MLFRLIDYLKSFRLFRWFIVSLRIILGLAFIYPALPKVLNQSFTTISTDNPIGYFFDCLHRLPLYWEFLGWMQIICGLLLITQRFALIGAILFTGIMSNIFIITVSLQMRGTPYITFLMLMAGLLMLLWDYEKLKPLFKK